MIDLFVSVVNGGFSIDHDTKMAVSLSPSIHVSWLCTYVVQRAVALCGIM